MPNNGHKPPVVKSCAPSLIKQSDCPCGTDRPLNRGRRTLLKLGLLAATWSPVSVMAARKPEKMRPQPGDNLVFAFGEREGQLILDDDIKMNAAPVEAYPKYVAETSSESIIRDRSRLNMVLVMRLLPESLNKAMNQYVTDGLVAYSAVCTHTGCTVEGWNADSKQMICPCHGSLYDATNGASVVKGPAPKPLAMLPLRLEAGEIIVAGKFSRKVGFQQQRY